MTVETLTRALLKSLLNPESSGLDVVNLGGDVSLEAVETLRLHRLSAPVWSHLKALGLHTEIPVDRAAELNADYWVSLARNRAQAQVLSRIIARLNEMEVDPVLLKGGALLNTVYQDLGARPMCDSDLLVTSIELPIIDSVLADLGFSCQSSTADARNYTNADGVLIDVHHRFRLFEGRERDELTQRVKPRFLELDTIRMLEPNAMLAHLVYHLHGHRGQTGYLLAWVLDIALAFDHWRNELDCEQIEGLLPDGLPRAFLHHVARFVGQELGGLTPVDLPSQPQADPGLSLVEVMRSRRRGLWSLESPRGWMRLIACLTGARPRRGWPWPRVSDLALWPVDAMRERRCLGTIQARLAR